MGTHIIAQKNWHRHQISWTCSQSGGIFTYQCTKDGIVVRAKVDPLHSTGSKTKDNSSDREDGHRDGDNDHCQSLVGAHLECEVFAMQTDIVNESLCGFSLIVSIHNGRIIQRLRPYHSQQRS